MSEEAFVRRQRSFTATSSEFAAGRSSPRDYLEGCIVRIEELEPKVGAFVTLDLLKARNAGDRSSARWRAGKPLSLIDGMPVGVKDIIETADMPTEQGSAIFAGWRTNRDAASVMALREAGAVVVGKTVTTEFAATEPRGTRNPWDLDRTPGGSSSGSAAAVAAGMLPAALGTQVVASILRPASFCGVVGMKPSVGAINRGGSYDGLSQSSHGALAITLADAWAMLREIASRAGGDPGFPGLAGPMTLPPAVKPRCLVKLETSGWGAAEEEARQLFSDLLEKLAASGVRILTRKDSRTVAIVEDAIAEANALSRAINAWESRWPLNAYRDRPELSRAMLARLAEAEAMVQDDYRKALDERDRIRRVYAGLSSLCDGTITLSAPGEAPLGLAWTGNPNFVVPGSLLGIPAFSLPLFEIDGLPLGFQLMGFDQRDAEAAAIAAWLETRFVTAVSYVASASLRH